MKKYILFTVIAFFVFFSLNKSANADGINFSLVNTTYNYSFPANVFLEDSTMGYSLTYNFYLNPMWSIDLGYTDYGSGTRSFGLINTEVDASAFSLAVRGSMVVGTISSHDINVHGLLGVTMADMDITAGASTLNDNDSGMTYGFGTSVMLSPVDEITLMYKKADLDFDNTVNFEYNPETLELGYTRRF